MFKKIISLTIAIAFFMNSACYGLSPQPGSTQAPTQHDMQTAAGRLFLATNPLGGIPAAIGLQRGFRDASHRTPLDLEKYGIRFVQNPDQSKLPEGWEQYPINQMTDFVAALKYFMEHEAQVPEGFLEIQPGRLTAEEKAISITNLHLTRDVNGKVTKGTLLVDEGFIKAWNDIKKNNIHFTYNFPEEGKREAAPRTVGVAEGLLSWVAKHVMTDIAQATGQPKDGALGHIVALPGSDLRAEESEETTNLIGGRYALVTQAIKLWFLASYCIDDSVRYDNDAFLERMLWIFDKDLQDKSREDSDKPLKLYEEFPALMQDAEKRQHAIDLALSINESYFSRSDIKAVEIPSFKTAKPRMNRRLQSFLRRHKIDPKKTFLFAMSGGDCAGPNSAYYGAVLEAKKLGYTVLGVINGLEGLGMDPGKFVDYLVYYTPEEMRKINLKGKPSIDIGSSRARFDDPKKPEQKKNILTNTGWFAGGIFIGGDDHSKQFGEMAEEGVPLVVLPKTIDYDLLAEAMGAHSAITEANVLLHRAHESARQEKFIQVIELMGRNAGWIAFLASQGLGEGAFSLIPEKPSYFKHVLIKALETIRDNGYLTIPMAEGYQFEDFAKNHKDAQDTLFYDFLKLIPFLKEKFESKGQQDTHGNPKLSGISEYLSLALRYLPQLAAKIEKEIIPLLMTKLQLLRR